MFYSPFALFSLLLLAHFTLVHSKHGQRPARFIASLKQIDGHGNIEDKLNSQRSQTSLSGAQIDGEGNIANNRPAEAAASTQTPLARRVRRHLKTGRPASTAQLGLRGQQSLTGGRSTFCEDCTRETEATGGSVAGGLADEPVNFVINCPGDKNRLARFKKHMDKAGLKFEVFPCVQLTRETLQAAIHDRFLGHLAMRGDLKETGALGVALAHIKLLDLIVSRNIPAANIFEDDEVVFDSYRTDRQKVLTAVPNDADFVNLNPFTPRGEQVKGTDLKLLKMVKGIPRWSNIWLSNYFVSAKGAQKLVGMMRTFDLGPSGDEQIDWYLVALFSTDCCDLNGYAYDTNKLSMHCHTASTKETMNKKGMSLLAGDPVNPALEDNPVCLENDPEGMH